MGNRRPLSRREDESYDALHDGVPAWLQSTLAEFVVTRMTVSRGFGPEPHRAMLQSAERALHWPLDWQTGAESAFDSIWALIRNNAEALLDFVDFCLGTLEEWESPSASRLADQLKEGHSTWTVDVIDGKYGLVRRVDPTVADAAKAVMSSAGRAGKLLTEAWAHAYGRQPDPSTAYREAVRAVEAIGAPVILPKDPKATLGTMIAAIRDAPAKWEVVLQPVGGDAMVMLNETMRLLWTSQLDRHGTADESVPLHVSPEEAQTAVHLAVTLVHLFSSGAIRARS
jgi:hypothetical protein